MPGPDRQLVCTDTLTEGNGDVMVGRGVELTVAGSGPAGASDCIAASVAATMLATAVPTSAVWATSQAACVWTAALGSGFPPLLLMGSTPHAGVETSKIAAINPWNYFPYHGNPLFLQN